MQKYRRKELAGVSKDDYFVLSYSVLKYLYECFKAGEKADVDMFSPVALGINNGYWCNLIESLANEGYITGVAFSTAVGSISGVKVYNMKITQKGIEFLQENSRMKKAAEFIKTAIDIIPGI